MADPDLPAAVPAPGDAPEPGDGDADPAAGQDPPVTAATADDDWVPL